MAMTLSHTADAGVFVKELQRPWGVAFDKLSNDTYITTEEEEHVYRYKPPNQGLWGELGLINSSDERQQTRTFAQFDKVFTNERVEVPNGLVKSFSLVQNSFSDPHVLPGVYCRLFVCCGA